MVPNILNMALDGGNLSALSLEKEDHIPTQTSWSGLQRQSGYDRESNPAYL